MEDTRDKIKASKNQIKKKFVFQKVHTSSVIFILLYFYDVPPTHETHENIKNTQKKKNTASHVSYFTHLLEHHEDHRCEQRVRPVILLPVSSRRLREKVEHAGAVPQQPPPVGRAAGHVSHGAVVRVLWYHVASRHVKSRHIGKIFSRKSEKTRAGRGGEVR